MKKPSALVGKEDASYVLKTRPWVVVKGPERFSYNEAQRPWWIGRMRVVRIEVED
jgi:hypothetical protein